MSNVYIGLEYEPQLTLLDYGPKSVNVYMNTIDAFKIEEYAPYVDLSIPWYLMQSSNTSGIGISHDLFSNLEVRTQPCLVEDVCDAIHEQTIALKEFVEMLALHVGSVGVLLPPSVPYVIDAKTDSVGSLDQLSELWKIWRSKHVSLSYSSEWLDSCVSMHIPMEKHETNLINTLLSEYETLCNTRFEALYNTRLHIKVPYAYCTYKELVNNLRHETNDIWFRGLSQKPQLIAYAYAKQKAHLVNSLV